MWARICASEGAAQGNDWSYDFVFERTHDGRPLRMLTLVDEYTRGECLAIDVERRLDSEDVLERLEALFVSRETPEFIRSDNGSEFTAKAVREWLARVGVQTLYIAPANPWENGYIGVGRRDRRGRSTSSATRTVSRAS